MWKQVPLKKPTKTPKHIIRTKIHCAGKKFLLGKKKGGGVEQLPPKSITEKAQGMMSKAMVGFFFIDVETAREEH